MDGMARIECSSSIELMSLVSKRLRANSKGMKSLSLCLKAIGAFHNIKLHQVVMENCSDEPFFVASNI
jgi:hypothetical protein